MTYNWLNIISHESVHLFAPYQMLHVLSDDPDVGYGNWCFCAACLVPGICGNGKCEIVQNGTLVSSFKCVCDPGYANILNMTAGYCANQCKYVLSGFCLLEYSYHILGFVGFPNNPPALVPFSHANKT